MQAFIYIYIAVLTDLRHGQLLIQAHGHIKHEEYGSAEHEDENHHLRAQDRMKSANIQLKRLL